MRCGRRTSRAYRGDRSRFSVSVQFWGVVRPNTYANSTERLVRYYLDKKLTTFMFVTYFLFWGFLMDL